MTEPKRLYRSRKDRMIAGVCGGLGEYFNVDPVLLRIAFVILILFSGTGLILYLILAIVVPNEPEPGEVEKKADFEEGVKDIAEGTKKMAEEAVKSIESSTRELKESNDWLSNKRNLLGLFLILIGLIALTNQLFPGFFSWKVFWPIALILIGVCIIFQR